MPHYFLPVLPKAMIKTRPYCKTTQAVPVSHQGDKEFSFIARPFRTSELSFRVGGPIDRFDVYAGNRYQQGSIIAEIDPRDFRIRKERAEAIYHQAKAEFERIQKLYDKGNVSASTYEKAKADYITAKQLSIQLPMNWKTHALSLHSMVMWVKYI